MIPAGEGDDPSIAGADGIARRVGGRRRANENLLPAEFRLIAEHFRPLAGEGALDLRDDAAVFTPPPGRQIVIAADAMVESVHFLPDDPADLVARKLLRTNLSDLAAMGATPFAYLLTTSLPKSLSPTWLQGFAQGLTQDQAEFTLHLLGGDTTSTPGPISLSLTILGTIAGPPLRRNGARPGDQLCVSGSIGDGALGLLAAQGKLPDPDGFLAGRYRLPQPRLALGQALLGLATACMDVSDGLVQDAGHLARESGCALEIQAVSVPLSPQARAVDNLPLCLTGGDDYELLFALPPGAPLPCVPGIPVSRIGTFLPGRPSVTVRAPDGAAMELPRGGWSHFA